MSRIQNLPMDPDPHTLGLNPWHFMKAGHCVVGPGAQVFSTSTALDWEAELAVVIGLRARNVGQDEALDYVAGYCAANDLSARERGKRDKIDPLSPFKYDWIAHKNFDGSCPLGPWLVPAFDVPDPQALAIKLWVNDTIRQDSNTDNMIFSIAEQIAHLSSIVTLHPGDVILTGTPAGVGAETGERLYSGDVVRITIDGLGDLITTIG
jgi:2-keto-4-pentenoate hydratase/2-oxohepta-3-ene-1,7-dioic acid hydratase in catechol pathway